MQRSEFLVATEQTLFSFGFIKKNNGYFLPLDEITIAIKRQIEHGSNAFYYGVIVNALHASDRYEDELASCDTASEYLLNIGNSSRVDYNSLLQSEYSKMLERAIEEEIMPFKRREIELLKKYAVGGKKRSNEKGEIPFDVWELKPMAREYLNIQTVEFFASASDLSLAIKRARKTMKKMMPLCVISGATALLTTILSSFWGITFLLIPTCVYLFALLKFKTRKQEKKVCPSPLSHHFVLRNQVVFKDGEKVTAEDMKLKIKKFKDSVYFELGKYPYLLERFCAIESEQAEAERTLFEIYNKYYKK